jgi:hypothetical protein
MLWPSPSRLTSELPGQSGPGSARSFGQLGARSGHGTGPLVPVFVILQDPAIGQREVGAL